MHGIIERLARIFAQLGGLVLTALILLTCLSVLGRSLNAILHGDVFQSFAPGLARALLATGVGPINGDFELVEAGMAFAIFSFLPLCQLGGAHASVDVFTARLPRRINRGLRLVIELVFAACLAIIAWQLFLGTQSKFASGQTSLLLQYPVWWSYALCLCGAVMAALVAVYVAALRAVEFATGRVVLPDDMEADH